MGSAMGAIFFSRGSNNAWNGLGTLRGLYPRASFKRRIDLQYLVCTRLKLFSNLSSHEYFYVHV